MSRMRGFDLLLDLIDDISDAKVEQQELEECGDLEERLEIALRIEELEHEHFRQALLETDPTED